MHLRGKEKGSILFISSLDVCLTKDEAIPKTRLLRPPAADGIDRTEV